MKDNHECEEKMGKGGCDAVAIEKSAHANQGRSESMTAYHANKDKDDAMTERKGGY